MDQESNKNAGSTNPEANAPPKDNANAASNQDAEGASSNATSNKETEGVKSLSSFGVPTLTHTKDGKKIVLYHQVKYKDNQVTHIQRKSFIDKYGFDPETGNIVRTFLVHKLPLAWRDRVLKQDSDTASGESNETLLSSGNDLENTVVQQRAPVEPAPMGGNAAQTLGEPLNRDEVAAPPTGLTVQQRKDLTQKIQSMKAWELWLKSTINDNKSLGGFQGSLPPPECIRFYVVSGAHKDALETTLAGGNPETKEAARTHISLCWKKEANELGRRAHEETDDLINDFEQIETASLHLWMAYCFAVSYLKECTEEIMTDRAVETDLHLLCQVGPTLRKQYYFLWRQLRKIANKWERVTGKKSGESATLKHVYNLMNNIYRHRRLSVQKWYETFMTDVLTKIVPFVTYNYKLQAGYTNPGPKPRPIEDDRTSICGSRSDCPSGPSMVDEYSDASDPLIRPCAPWVMRSLAHLQSQRGKITSDIQAARDEYFKVPERDITEQLAYFEHVADARSEINRLDGEIKSVIAATHKPKWQTYGQPQFESTRNQTKIPVRTSPKDRLRYDDDPRPERTSTRNSDRPENYSRLERAPPPHLTQARRLPEHFSNRDVRRAQINSELNFGTDSNEVHTDQTMQRQARSSRKVEDTFALTSPDKGIVGHSRQPVPPRDAHGDGHVTTRPVMDGRPSPVKRSSWETTPHTMAPPPSGWYQGGNVSQFRKSDGTKRNTLEDIDNPPIFRQLGGRLYQVEPEDTEVEQTWNQIRRGQTGHIGQYEPYQANESDHRYGGNNQPRDDEWGDHHDDEAGDHRNDDYRDHRDDDGRDRGYDDHNNDRGNNDRNPPHRGRGNPGRGDGGDPNPRRGGGGDGAPPPPPPPPNRGSNPQDGVDPNAFLNHLSRIMQGATNTPQDMPPEVLDGFFDAQIMERWYRSLPAPWNKIPKMMGRKGEILKTIALIFDTEKTHFQGHDDGTYFTWRALIIENIHRQPIPIVDKVIMLQRATNRDHALLKTICGTQSFTTKAYHDIIVSLETNFGGTTRAQNHLRSQLLSGDPLDYNKQRSVQLMRARINKFLEHLVVHGVVDQVNKADIFDMVISNKMSKYLATRFREDAVTQKYEDPNSLSALAEWLEDREVHLAWTESHHTSGLMLKNTSGPVNPRSRRTFQTHAESSEDEYWDATENAFPTHPDKRFIKDDPSRFGRPRGGPNASSSREQRKPLRETALVAEGDHVESDRDSEIDLVDIDQTDLDQALWDLDQGTLISCLATFNTQLPVCSVCGTGRHVLHRCDKFKGMSLAHRSILVNTEKRCDNCLHPSHARKDCTSKFRCQKEGCGQKHHTLLHYPEKSKGPAGTKVTR